jgi:hypothetical protein
MCLALAEGKARNELLSQAVDAYNNALLVFSRRYSPTDWAMAHNNLGIALYDQAQVAKGETQYEFPTKQQLKKKAHMASTGNGRRPQPRFLKRKIKCLLQMTIEVVCRYQVCS